MNTWHSIIIAKILVLYRSHGFMDYATAAKKLCHNINSSLSKSAEPYSTRNWYEVLVKLIITIET